ncbi:MAG: cytochrome P450 [Solirubrobacterales bacterium]
MAELEELDDLLRPEAVADPFPTFAALREADPVRWSARHRAWLITRHDDCAAAHTDRRLSSDRMTPMLRRLREREAPAQLIAMVSVLADWMTFKDGEGHRRLRRLVSRAFTPRVVARMRDQIAAITDDLIDDLPSSGPVDFVAAFAYPLPAIVIAEMLGVPSADRDRFKGWSSDISSLVFGAVDDPDRHDRAESGMTELVEYFEGLIEASADHGDETLLDHLVRVRTEDGDALSRNELLAMCTLLLFGGHETTTNLLGSGVLALLRHPDQKDRLLADPSLAEPAVEELMRFDGPTRLSVRVAAEPLDLRDRSIQAGDRVFLVLAAANRDPARFDDPDVLDIGRKPNQQIGFGLGPHYCLGAPLARLEGQIAIPRLLRRLPNLRLESGASLSWRPTLLSRSLVSLPASYDAA